MKVNNMRKFIGSIEEEDMIIIERAAKIEKIPRYILIRKGAIEYAKKIIKKIQVQKEDDTKTNS